MSLGLLLPAGLIALLALAIPLLLHLVRQTEQTRIEFAALGWLVARAQPRRRLRVDEWLLLASRLLLLALLAFWLARPVLNGHPDLRPWVVVDPAIDAAQGAAHRPANLPKDAQWHWLAPDFPSIEQPAPHSTASIASLLRELDATLPQDVRLIAIVPEQFDATDAAQIRLSRAITWTPVLGTSAFSTSATSKSMRIAAYVDAQHQIALPYLRAAAIAWLRQTQPDVATTSLREIADVGALHTDDTHLLWLASTAVQARQRQWIRNGGSILLAQDSPVPSLDWQDAQVAWRAMDGTPLALRIADGKGAWIRMLVPFAPESLPALLEPEFPQDFQEALEANPLVAMRTRADAYAPVSNPDATPTAPPSPRPLDDLIAVLIALLFGIERWLAMSMRRLQSA